MGKRSSSQFERKPRDFYPTPQKAADVLCNNLKNNDFTYHEPCAGNGALVHGLTRHRIECSYQSDIEPQHRAIKQRDVFDLQRCEGDYFITNPPWSRDILHPLISHLSGMAQTWLLFDADWMHTIQAREYLKRCEMIISVGRLKWIEGSKNTGKDNCAWYLFSNKTVKRTQFVGRC